MSHQYPIRRLEVHCTHACNLNCYGCTHYSNHHHNQHVSVKEADEWMKLWTPKILPNKVSVMGGEPALQPDLPNFMKVTRRNWPHSIMSLVTNGLALLKAHPDIIEVLRDLNCNICVSSHHPSKEFTDVFVPKMEEIRDQCEKHQVEFVTRNSYNNWRSQYKGYGDEMMPYDDGNSNESWRICPSRRCINLFDGKLWKCPNLAYLKMQDAKFDLNKAWEPYLKYQPLDPSCTMDQVVEFIGRKGEHWCGMCPAYRSALEHWCGMRPTYRSKFLLPNPLR